MVSAFDALPYAHHAIRVTGELDTRPGVEDVDAIDTVFTDSFGFALRYEIEDLDTTSEHSKYRYGYLLPRGKTLTGETIQDIETRLHTETALDSPTVDILALDPTNADLDGMAFLGTPPSEALRTAWDRLRDALDDQSD